MDAQSIRNFIGTALPWVAAAASGNVPALVGLAAKAVSDATGKPVDPTQDAIHQAVATASPDELLKLKTADDQIALQAQALGFKSAADLAGIAEQDRESARGRQIALRDNTPAVLAYMIIGGFFVGSVAEIVAVIGWADWVAKVPPQGWLLIGNVSGYLAAEAKAAAAYYFGTTAGSDKKTDIIAQAEPVQIGGGNA